MHIGHYVSGAGHVGLIGFLLIGPLFNSDPLPFDVTNVSMISAEEYAALVAAERPPETESTPVAAPSAPVNTEDSPPPAPTQDTAPTETPPPAPPVPAPSPEVVPEQPAPPTPVARPEDTPPPTPAPPAAEDVAVVLPERSLRPRPRPAPRVAPEPVAAPAPEAVIADQQQDAVVPDETETPTPNAQDPQDATTPEEATTEIVTEAEDPPAGAPERSVRPRGRPRVPAAQPETPPATEPAGETRSAVADALAEALGGENAGTAAAAPSGPPLTSGERDDLRVAVQQCWNVNVGSPAASVTVVVAMQLDRSGKVVGGSLRRVAAKGGDASAAGAAFEAARRAILRCQKDGYDLPIEKYDQWKEIEMTFNPEKMRLR